MINVLKSAYKEYGLPIKNANHKHQKTHKVENCHFYYELLLPLRGLGGLREKKMKKFLT